jgi:hypothetical protein
VGIKTVLIAGIFFGFASAAAAEDCKTLADPAARLACFDKPPKALAKAAKKATPKDEFFTAKALLQKKMIDPESARFSEMFKIQAAGGEGDIYCGLVNSKNRMGGYAGNAGFIYEKNLNRATIMATGDSDPDYSMQAAAAYCVHCAPDPRSDRSFNSFCPSMLKFRR